MNVLTLTINDWWLLNFSIFLIYLNAIHNILMIIKYVMLSIKN